MKLQTLAFTAAFLVPAIASAQDVGQFALAQWQGGDKWYPGVVMSRSGGSVQIEYDDGSVEVRPSNQVRPYNWRIGSRLECQWTDGQWYAAAITAMDRDAVSLTIRYDDGTIERTLTMKCRS